MSNDNEKLDRAEALAVIIAQAVRAMHESGADNQQIITALQIAVDEIAKSEGPKSKWIDQKYQKAAKNS